MVEFAFFIIADFIDNRIEPLTHPADCPMLFRQVGTAVLVVGMGEDLQSLFKPDSAVHVAPQSLALAPIEVEPHGKV